MTIPDVTNLPGVTYYPPQPNVCPTCHTCPTCGRRTYPYHVTPFVPFVQGEFVCNADDVKGAEITQ